MKIVIVSPKNKTVFNFRGDLIKDMLEKGHQVYVVGPNRDYIDDVLALGITDFIEIPFVKDNTNLLGDLKYFKKLIVALKSLKPDMVFSYTIKPVIYGSMAAKCVGTPHIYAMVTGLGRVHSSKDLKTKFIKFLTRILYKMAFKACDKVIFQNNDDICELVMQKYLPISKAIRVNGSGVNMNRFKKSELPTSAVFLMVGRIIREKGVLEFCEAARKVKAKYPHIRCILLGGFDTSIGALKEEEIRPYIEDGSIEFPGEVKDPIAFYNQCTTFVLPSYYREGLPRTILEAMSCGRPIITTNWPGCREAVQHEVNGLLVPIRDSEALSRAMLRLVDDSKVLSKMATESFELCKNKYEVSIVNESMREVLHY